MDMLESNSSLTCAETTLLVAKESIFSNVVDVTVKVVFSIYYILLIAVGIPLNLLILYLFVKFKKLRDVSFTIACQIAFANVVYAGIKFSEVTSNISGHLILGLNFCCFNALLKFSVLYTRSCLVFMFSLDRFASVFAPFNYPKYSYKVTLILCGITWCLALINSVIQIPPLLDCFGFNPADFTCISTNNCNDQCQIFGHILMATHFIPVMTVPVGLFFALYVKGWKIRHQANKMLGLSSKMSDQHWRALHTFALLFLAVFLVTLPPVLVIQFSSYFKPVTQTFIFIISPAIYSILIMTDPIIVLRNADVKEVLKILVSRWKKRCCKVFQFTTERTQTTELELISPQAQNARPTTSAQAKKSS